LSEPAAKRGIEPGLEREKGMGLAKGEELVTTIGSQTAIVQAVATDIDIATVHRARRIVLVGYEWRRQKSIIRTVDVRERERVRE
jgi:hypothetical protein